MYSFSFNVGKEIRTLKKSVIKIKVILIIPDYLLTVKVKIAFR